MVFGGLERWLQKPSAPMTRLALLICLLWLGPGLSLLGCGSLTQRTTYTRTVRQAAVAPAPGGPHATGRQLEKRQIAVEGGFSDTVTSPGHRPRERGQAPGQVLLNKGVRLRGAMGVTDWLEVGVEMEVLLPGEGSALTGDLSVTTEGNSALVMGGPQVRVEAPWRPITVGASAEFIFSSLPYRWQIYEDAVREDFTEDGVPVTHSSSYWTKTGSLFYFYFRFGVHAAVHLLPGLGAQLGFMLHNHPVFFGEETVTEVCDNLNGCSGRVPEDLDHTRLTMMGTAFLSITADIYGPLVLVAQGFCHAAGDSQLLDHGRFGGDLALRLVF